MSETAAAAPAEVPETTNATDANKLFVGGLSWETSEEKLQDYFSDYGDVAHCMIMMNRETGKSRGFGFVTFKNPDSVKMVLAVPQHSIDNRVIDPKLCAVKSVRPKKEEPPAEKHEEKEFGKIFLGGLPADINESGLKEFFAEYGKVTEVIIMYDQEKKRPRGFGFLTFDSDEPVNKLVANKYITIRGKQVEVKKASPQGSNKHFNNGGPRGGYGYGPGGFGNDGNHSHGPYNNSYNGQQGPGGPPGGPNAQMPPNMYGYPPMWGPWGAMPPMNGMPPMGGMPPSGAPGPWGAQPGQPPMAWPGYGYPGPWGMPPPGMYGMPQPPAVPPVPGQAAPPAPVGQPGQQPPQQPGQTGQPPVPPASYPANYYGQPGQAPSGAAPAAGQGKPEGDSYGQAGFNSAGGDSTSTGTYGQSGTQASSNGGYASSQDSGYSGKANGSGDNYYASSYQYPPANGPRHTSTHHDAQQAQFGTRASSSYHPYRRP